MKVAGFTFIRNAIRYDYPVVEAILSVLPLCDLFIVAVGKSEDDTLGLISRIGSPKIRIIETVWDDSLRTGGRVLADETNKAFDAIPPEYDWAFYIQGDEVLHEKYHPAVTDAMEKWLNDSRVEGLLFDYLHFYGSYDFVADAPNWYRREIRVVRNDKKIRSYKDAQGFRTGDRKLRVKPVDACICHYGWVKHPEKQQDKLETFNKLWHDDEWMEKNIIKAPEFDYSVIGSLKHFEGTHPAEMKSRILEKNWHFDFDPTKKKLSCKNRALLLVESMTGYRPFEYRNYRLI
jgi:hypothetical protein